MTRILAMARLIARDTIILAAVVLVFMSLIRMAEARTYADSVDTALVFVVDASSSMDREQLQLARQSHAEAIMSPEVLSAIQSGHFRRSAFAFVEFSSQAVTVVGWTIVDGPESAAGFARQILGNKRPDIGDLTGIGGGLARAFELMNALPAEPLYRVVDVVGDGKANTGIDPALVRDMLVSMDSTINGMPMNSSEFDDIEEYYLQKVIGGPRAFSIPLNNMQDMPMVLRRKLILEIG